MSVLEVRREIDAPAAVVWGLVSDSSTWPRWTTIEEFSLVQPGDPSGLGEVRHFRTGSRLMVEEIVEKVPPHRLSYTVLRGLAVRGYRADIDMVALTSTRTGLTWHTEFTAKVPGLGWLYQRTLLSYTRRFVDGLAGLSEREAAREPGAGS